ncbi:MAG: sterol desaturase family protein [Blastocatellia bacterium]|nr:sterol desaturase family protein [Blastocatellia bacterium]
MLNQLIFPGISLFFFLLERLFPKRQQPIIREAFWTDLAHIIFNAYIFGIFSSYMMVWIAENLPALKPWWSRVEAVHLVSQQPLWLQALVLFVLKDFVQWLIHNLLHRVSWLWAFHKVHHSIEIMDWMGNMRYHWIEPLIYRMLQYIPIAVCGFDPKIFFWMGAFDLAMGYFNHSNLNASIGPLKYIFNSPGMHIWHHDARVPTCNLGIALSVWDWIFGTAYYPAEENRNLLGFKGVENYPKNWLTQLFVPLTLLLKRAPQKANTSATTES